MWPYRDWVINAMNNDMPFDQFTIEQLAGDLLPDPSPSQLVATGFHRNVPTNFSGGSKVPEVRANILHDRVATTGTVWLGMTLECCQCHDHKFDSVSQREYYQFYAYFNQAIPEVAQKGVGMFRKLFVGREVEVHASEADRQRAEKLRDAIAATEKQLEDSKQGAALASTEKKTASKANGSEVFADFEGENPLAGQSTTHKAKVTAVRDTPADGGKFAIKAVVDASASAAGYYGIGFNLPVRDQSEAAEIRFWIKTDIEGSFNLQIHSDTKDVSVFGFSIDESEPGTWKQVVAPVASFSVPPWARRKADWSRVNMVKITAFGNGPYAGRYVMLDQFASLKSYDPAMARSMRLVKRVKQLKTELDAITTSTMVMQDAEMSQATHLMIRGDYTTPGDRVDVGVPTALHPLDAALPRNRLGLAKWLVAAENPLTARVAVNRVWAEIFGQGIVTTLDDFGMQGAAPSHPQLLDWLAIRFVEDGWSVKKLIKTIVMTSTYQQTSAAPATLIQRDPENKLYARGPRFRLPAELVRDNLLAVSGLLSDKIGGAMVHPVQPDGLWEEIPGRLDASKYPTSVGEDRYRRGIYTVWRRGSPYPSMVIFDTPDRSTCTVQRDRSNTPSQALTLLNDPVYVEMATAFAKLMESWSGSDRVKVVRAFRRALARHPNDDDVDTLLELYQDHQSWFAVAQVLMNLDEAISKP
jgi:hypothetical protein